MIPPPYRGPTHGKGVIPVAGATVRDCLNAVEAEYPGFGSLVFAGDGELHRFVKLFCNGEPVERLDLLVGEADEIEVVAAIGGG
jgi:sulfur carrier protein ThiS